MAKAKDAESRLAASVVRINLLTKELEIANAAAGTGSASWPETVTLARFMGDNLFSDNSFTLLKGAIFQSKVGLLLEGAEPGTLRHLYLFQPIRPEDPPNMPDEFRTDPVRAAALVKEHSITECLAAYDWTGYYKGREITCSSFYPQTIQLGRIGGRSIFDRDRPEPSKRSPLELLRFSWNRYICLIEASDWNFTITAERALVNPKATLR